MCDFPFYVKNPRYPVYSNEPKIPVPCGKCPPCQARRTSNWTFRLQKEDEISLSSLFVTLTYDTDHVPISERGFMTLDKSDVQKFFKRLRKQQIERTGNRLRIRYYLAGEYGSKTFRPHYHLILFDCLIPDQIHEIWGLGECHLGQVTGASIGYTCKYINKGKIIPMHKNDDRLPEFSLMSKKMGSSYLTPEMINWHKQDINRCYVVTKEGLKLSLPRYYRDKIYDEQEKKIQAENVAQRAIESENEARYEYWLLHGTEQGYEATIENRAKEKLNSHRLNGLNSRKI